MRPPAAWPEWRRRCATGTPAATDASCDGIDDNCNGAADEGYVADSKLLPAGRVRGGECGQQLRSWSGDGAVRRERQRLTDASCDGIDDNCNGAADEGYVADSKLLPAGRVRGGECGQQLRGRSGDGAVRRARLRRRMRAATGSMITVMAPPMKGTWPTASCFLPGACAAGNGGQLAWEWRRAVRRARRGGCELQRDR